MIVCSCNVLSDRQVRDAVSEREGSVRTAGQVYRCLGCSPQCGRCARTIRGIIDQALGAGCGSCALDCPVAHVHSHDHVHSNDHAHSHGHAAHDHAAHGHQPARARMDLAAAE